MSAPADLAAATAAAQLLDYLRRARWFAGKGRRTELVGLTRLPWLNEPGSWPAVRCLVAEIGYLERGDAAVDPSATELYQLMLSYWPQPRSDLIQAEIGPGWDPELGDVVVYDATHDRQACTLFLQRLREGAEFAADGSRVSFHPLVTDAMTGDLEPRLHTGQQSNTSVMYGDVAMLKLFRRLEVGRNLDIEVHESLSRSGVGDVARLYGWVAGSWPATGGNADTLSADLAMVVEKLPDAQDGWELALASLAKGVDFADHAGALGGALAEIHQALREQFPTGTTRGAAIASAMTGRLHAAAARAPALVPHVPALAQCFESLAEVSLATQRVHGDFHLGQTLSTPTGWKVIDFEGEPVKTLPERAEPDSGWRDIAGMLRSFDYAAASVPGPDSRRWAERCRAAFLQGYAGGALSETDERVLRAYLADKAVYEVGYEVRARPDWVHIPLAALEAITADLSTQGLHRSGPAGQTKE